jgi:hypothetical protein
MPTPSAQRALLSEFQQLSAAALSRHADAYAGGRLTLAEFERLFKQELKDMYIASVWTANGATQGTQAQYGLAGRRLRDQYGFMPGFFKEIEAGQLSIDQIKARAAMYPRSSSQVLEQLGASEPGLPRLPHYPGDGSTECLSNCNCGLRTVKVEQGYDVFWDLTTAEHCDDCRRRANGSPLRVRFGRVTNSEAWA